MSYMNVSGNKLSLFTNSNILSKERLYLLRWERFRWHALFPIKPIYQPRSYFWNIIPKTLFDTTSWVKPRPPFQIYATRDLWSNNHILFVLLILDFEHRCGKKARNAFLILIGSWPLAGSRSWASWGGCRGWCWGRRPRQSGTATGFVGTSASFT